MRASLWAGLALALVACGSVSGPVGIIDVNGTAYGAKVTVWSNDGREQTTTAAGDGTFRISGVWTPYDILFDYGAARSLILGSRAARHDVALPPAPDPDPEDLSTVSFGLSPAQPYNATTLWVVDCGDEVLASHSGSLVELDRGFYLDAPRSCDAKVLVLNAARDGYGGQGNATVELRPAATTQVDVTLREVILGNLVTFQVTDPNPDTTLAAIGLVWPARKRGYAAHVIHEGALTSTTLPAPLTSELGLSVIFGVASDGAVAQGSAAWRAVALDAASEVRQVALPSTDILLAPAPDARLADRFAMRPRDGSVYVFVIGSLSVTTASPELTVAQLAAHGIVLESGARALRGETITAASVDDELSLDGIVRQRDAVRIQSRARTFIVD